jgi:flagellar hook capping protein FlgD
VTPRYGALVDRFGLLFVDHPVGTEAFAYGSTVVAGRRSQASHAVTEAGEDVTNLLNGTRGVFNAAAAAAVTVSTPLDSLETPLVIECANGGLRGHAIIVESQTPSGWQEVGVVHPRRVSSACVIDAVPPGPVRLRFTGYAYLSSVARLARETANVSSTWGTLATAQSSSAGDVSSAIGAEDTVTTALVGPDTLVATFSGPSLGEGAVRNVFLGVLASPVTASAASSAAASQRSSLPTQFALYQNAPNPFRGSTTIRCDLPVGRMVKLEIFDVSGRRVRTLVNRFMPAGRHSVVWDQRNDAGASLDAGVYFSRLQVDTFRDHKKLILMP